MLKIKEGSCKSESGFQSAIAAPATARLRNATAERPR